MVKEKLFKRWHKIISNKRIKKLFKYFKENEDLSDIMTLEQNIDLKNSAKDKLPITVYDLNASEMPNEPLQFQNTFKKFQKIVYYYFNL